LRLKKIGEEFGGADGSIILENILQSRAGAAEQLSRVENFS